MCLFSSLFSAFQPPVDFRLLPPRGHARLPGAVALRLFAALRKSYIDVLCDSYDYGLKPTYVIAIIDFELPRSDGNRSVPESCVTHYCTQDTVTGEKLPGAPEYFFLELKRFKKKVGELNNIQEKFLFLLNRVKELEDIPDGFGGNRAFDAFFQAAETANFTKKERMLYDQAMVTKTDIIYMKRESFEEGRAEGRSEGIAEGEARGRSEGEANKCREVAKKMLADGLDISTIVKYTGFSESDIENLNN